MEKKAELTTQQIVILIILIISFIVILLFLLFLNPWNVSDKEVCHNSVVMRGSPVLPSDAISLDCKTRYLCITKDGSCEKMTSPEIEKVKTKEEAYKVLADEMADCWWTFGEGKVDYVGKDMVPKHYCSICSQIAFDDSLEKVFSSGEIDKEEFYNYLSLTKISEKDYTYLDYLVGAQKVSNIYNGKFGTINLDKQYYVVTSIHSKTNWVKWGAVAGAVAAVTIIAAPVVLGSASIAQLVTLKGVLFIEGTAGLTGLGGHYVGNVVQGKSGNDYMPPTIIEAELEVYKALNCSSINTLA